jgi:hypothetical protein
LVDVDNREAGISNLQKVGGNMGLTISVHPGFRTDETDAVLAELCREVAWSQMRNNSTDAS